MDATAKLVDSSDPSVFGSIKENPLLGEKSTTSKNIKHSETENMKNQDNFYVQWIRPLIAEFFGQLIFAFLHSCAAFTIDSGSNAGNALIPAITDGLVVTILVILIGHISGAHVNFSVTTAVFIGGGIKWMMVPLYLIAQLLGSASGAGLAYVANGEATGSFMLGDGVGVGRGLLMEVVLTALLTLAVLLSAVELSSHNAAFAIGFSILIDILAGFRVSGGCMNPTLSFGPAVMAGKWQDYWVYWIGPILGAMVSGTIFRLFLGGEARLLFNKSDGPKAPFDEVKVDERRNRRLDASTSSSSS